MVNYKPPDNHWLLRLAAIEGRPESEPEDEEDEMEESHVTALKHDNEGVTNRYRCPDCGKRWAADADDVPEGFQDACPACGEASWPLRHGMSTHQRFTAYWCLVFVAGWGFGFITGLAVNSADQWWLPLW